MPRFEIRHGDGNMGSIPIDEVEAETAYEAMDIYLRAGIEMSLDEFLADNLDYYEEGDEYFFALCQFPQDELDYCPEILEAVIMENFV